MAQTDIAIENARSHNLKGVTCRIPLGSLTLITGVSGCGKSTLAFDTLYAEGQRRYVSSMSTYARQFLERLPRPDVDRISNLPPAIAIEQRNSVTNARATVGTATEILDHLRLLFATVGETRCSACSRSVEPGHVEGIADQVLGDWGEGRLIFAAPMSPIPEEDGATWIERLVADGFLRALLPSGAVQDLDELPAGDVARIADEGGRIWVVVDRIVLKPSLDRRRIVEAVASGLARGGGELAVAGEGGARRRYLEGFACGGCGRVFPDPEPALFSFNSPLGACAECQGFGRIQALDWDRVVPDARRSLEDDAIAPFATPTGRGMRADLLSACRDARISTDVPFASLSESQRDFVFDGDEAAGGEWYGVRGFFDWLEERRYKVQSRVLIARYRRFDSCPGCGGARLCEDALAVHVGDRDLGALSRLSLEELHDWLGNLSLASVQQERAQRVIEALQRRIETTLTVGLGYVTLDRQVRTLSGGEAQRIQLATALGGSLTASLYVLDEPSVGLHPRDMVRLVEVIRAIRDHGNTVVVVEHAPEIIAAADHIIDLGPRAGDRGGEIVFEGSPKELLRHPDSLTAEALRGRGRGSPPKARDSGEQLRIIGAREHNLQDLDVTLPLRQLVAVTGVSGAGKSSLIMSVLVGNLLRERGEVAEAGACRSVEGGASIQSVVVMDQTPTSRSPRSNPATVSKAFDGIRRIFAETREARARGFKPGWFSFNVAGGRCDQCEGAGEVVIDMQFLDDIVVPCEECDGLRYRREVLEVQVDGRSIVDVLGMTVDQALDAFASDRSIAGRLAPLQRVGLGYLTLGQPLSTLSGGEHQRVRLARALAEPAGSVLYVFDEPTTGLHAADVEVLLDCLDELIAAGGSVIVIEHNLDVIWRADHVVDMGPEGGPGGGRVVAQGRPSEIAAVRESFTGAALRGDFG